MGSKPDRRDHRHAECEDDGKGEPRGDDAAKKLKGRKRHLAVDTSGLLLGMVVHAASIQDADGAWNLLNKIKPLDCWLQVVFADSIYNRLTMLLACFLLGLTLSIVRRLAGTPGFVVVPRRWLVERPLAWLGRWRRLSKLDFGHSIYSRVICNQWFGSMDSFGSGIIGLPRPGKWGHGGRAGRNSNGRKADA